MTDLVLDLGSHSAKLFERGPGGPKLRRTSTWEILRRPDVTADADFIDETIGALLDGSSPSDRVTAVATAAFRRRSSLARAARAACDRRGIRLRILDHGSEGELLVDTIRGDERTAGLIGVNIGGGSIQISAQDGEVTLLPFGALDLNDRFDLLGAPPHRRLAECIAWLIDKLPGWEGEFAYLGEERTYLERFAVPLMDGWCSAEAFRAFASRLGGMSTQELRTSSPFDPQWMIGSIASNCLVLALFDVTRAHRFRPVNADIGWAVLAGLDSH